MTSICLYFQVHQPYRLKWFWPDEHRDYRGKLFDLYFDEPLNEWTFHKVAGKCYHPATDIMLEHVDNLKGEKRKFKLSYSLTGAWVEQCEKWDKDLLEKFKQLAESGCCEFLGETYYHSLAGLFEDKTEFREQIRAHRQLMKDVFGYKTNVFRNTELLYHNDIANVAEEEGFAGIFTEGIEWLLEGWKSPNYLYQPRGCEKIKTLLRNYKLSDDVGYRFSAKWWSEWPLDAERYASWLSGTPGDTINICMDYETFGEHHWEDTGIFWFLKAFPYKVLDWEHLSFKTPSETVADHHAKGELNVPWYQTVSWADLERDPSAWLGNHMQHLCFNRIKGMETLVKDTKNADYLKTWRSLLISDHYYYMCTKGWGDGDVHTYFSHHGTPYDAAINYLSILADLHERLLLEKHLGRQPPVAGNKKPAAKKSTTRTGKKR